MHGAESSHYINGSQFVAKLSGLDGLNRFRVNGCADNFDFKVSGSCVSRGSWASNIFSVRLHPANRLPPSRTQGTVGLGNGWRTP